MPAKYAGSCSCRIINYFIIPMSQIRTIPTTFNPNLYNKAASHPLQSWEWAEARKRMGTSIVRIGEFEKDVLKHVFLMTIHPLPKTPFSIGYVPRSVLPSQKVISYMSTYAQKHNIIFIKFEPHLKKDEMGHTMSYPNFSVSPSPHPLFPQWTQVINLTQSEDYILKHMKPKTRYNIRLAMKKGITVKEESNEKGFEIFHHLYFETCKRQKYYGHNKEYHHTVWNALKNKIAHILIAYYQNIPLAAYELFLFKDVLYYPYGGSSHMHKNLMAANLIMWEAIRLGRCHGAQLFDMWGSTGPHYDTKDPYAGFTRFKEGYGTRFVEMVGSYDLIINPILYHIYGVVYQIRNWFLTR